MDARALALMLGLVVIAAASGAELKAPFAWTLSPPLVSPLEGERDGQRDFSAKDPTIVQHEGRWHLFITVRGKPRSHRIDYLSFARWEDANRAKRHTLTCREGYFCAPQVFYFRPHKKWYLVFQTGEPSRKLKLQPACSTTADISDPASWSQAKLLFPDADPRGVSRWIDFWVICDEKRAYLFFTSNNGRMWRMWTALGEFPRGFRDCRLALRADIFEASHTYRLLGQDQYLTIVEAQGPGHRRYYKAYLADRLDGAWRPLADTWQRPFAGETNVRNPDPAWADNISHGELLRAGRDETLAVDPAKLRFLVQAVTQKRKAGKKYGDIPWQLGILTPTNEEMR